MEVGMTCKCGDRECPLTGGNEVNDNKELTERARAFLENSGYCYRPTSGEPLLSSFMASFAAQEREAAVREFMSQAWTIPPSDYARHIFREMFGKDSIGDPHEKFNTKGTTPREKGKPQDTLNLDGR
jgi:hypothetical protein